MTVYAVKIRDKVSGKFLNMQGNLTQKGRIFSSLAYAKASVAGKLDLKNMSEIRQYKEREFKLYMGCEFVIHTDEGDKFESVQDYILQYLKGKNNPNFEYVKSLCTN